MSDEACLKVIEGCEVFTEHPDDNFLIDTFSNRLNAMDGLTDTQKNAYLKQHSKVLSDHVIPAYSQMIKGLTMLLGRGHNNWGLCNFPEGKAYYEAVVSADTGCDDSVEDLFPRLPKPGGKISRSVRIFWKKSETCFPVSETRCCLERGKCHAFPAAKRNPY